MATERSTTLSTCDSVWRATARIGDPPLPALPASTTTDVAVIGAGFTGLAAAHYLDPRRPGRL